MSFIPSSKLKNPDYHLTVSDWYLDFCMANARRDAGEVLKRCRIDVGEVVESCW